MTTIVNPMQVERKCNSCGGLKVITVPTVGYERWKRGEGYIQDCMPTVSKGDRELLISGTCNECFEALFPPDEDEPVDPFEFEGDPLERRKSED